MVVLGVGAGVVPGVAVLGAVPGVAVPGVAVVGAVPGATWRRGAGATVPGATVSVVVSGFVVVVPGGGPESGALIGGILVVLDGSLGLAGRPPGSIPSGPRAG